MRFGARLIAWRPTAAWTVAAWLAVSAGTAPALTPDSPEVKRLVKLGMATLEKPSPDARLGAKCLQALALYKGGSKSSPRIGEAIDACRKQDLDPGLLDVYSHGLAIILLCETDADRDLTRKYLTALEACQKDVGGWGYDGSAQGDTSQTQYMALGLWEARNRGLMVQRDTAHGLLKWLIATQDPEGGFGYQGNVAPLGGDRVAQSNVTPTMAAAAVSSLMIGADMFGMLQQGASAMAMSSGIPELPEGARVAQPTADSPSGAGPQSFTASGVDWRGVFKAVKAGDGWISRNLEVPAPQYPFYFLYALERYESFVEYRDGLVNARSKWYDQGYEYLLKSQKADGEWDGQCGPTPDTAFAVLFLIRSTQKSIKRTIGEGALVSGRGLPRKLAGARLRGGQVVTPLDAVGLDQFLGLLDADEADKLDQLADDPSALVTGDLDSTGISKLERTLRGGSPSARVLAARALGRSGDLDRVPALLFAMTDPDRRVVLEADSSLRYLSRRTRGGLREEFSEADRFATLEAWKRWYLRIRPSAVLELD
ncbi:MAG: hypothetical protein ACRCT8_17340 [Lacipirellulaceae bacterium]